MDATLDGLTAAAETGVRYKRLVADLRAGRLRGRRVGRAWVIARRDLEAYTARLRAEAAAAAGPFVVAERTAEEVREWWRSEMRTSQAAAASAARDYADRYAALTRTPGRPTPGAAAAFEAATYRLLTALRRVEHLDQIYGTVLQPLEAETARRATAARAAGKAVATPPPVDA